MCWRYVVLFGLALPACAAESLNAGSNDEVAADEAAATNFPARVLAELQFCAADRSNSSRSCRDKWHCPRSAREIRPTPF